MAFSQTSIFIPSPLSGCKNGAQSRQEESKFLPCFSKLEQLNTTPSHRVFSIGYRRAKSTQGNTNFKKRLFHKQHRDHYPRASKATALQNHNLWPCPLFSYSSMVKVQGQNSNRNTVKRNAENGQTFSIDEDIAGFKLWCQASRIRASRTVSNSAGRNALTMAGRVRIDSRKSWAFHIARVTLHHREVATWRHKRPTYRYLRCLFDRLPAQILTSDIHHWISWKNSELMVFGVQFFF